MNRTSPFTFAAAIACLVMTAHGQVTVSSGFEPVDTWSQIIFSPPPFSQSNIASSGGNPGRYAHMKPWLQSQTSASIGYLWAGGPVMYTGLTSLSVTLEYKQFSGPQVDFLPCLIQDNRAHYPFTSFATLGTSPSWTPVGPFTYSIAELTNLSGTFLNP